MKDSEVSDQAYHIVIQPGRVVITSNAATKLHQNRMETIKRHLDWSARFRVNMIGFEVEHTFAYPSNPVIGAPGAFTPAEVQEIVIPGLTDLLRVLKDLQLPALYHSSAARGRWHHCGPRGSRCRI